jgi:putative transposase
MRIKRVKQDEQNHNQFDFVVDEAKIAMIQMLLPLGLEAIKDTLLQEVDALAGRRYQHSDSPIKRWGSNPGSVFLGNQKVEIKVPRIRNTDSNKEVSLKSYEGLQNPSIVDNAILAMMVNGVSCRKYERAAETIPETFGIKKSAVSKKFIKASAKKLKELLERDLSQEDIVAIFIDGKSFAENQIVLAMGITLKGEKKMLGFVETSTENGKVIKEFLKGLVENQGLPVDEEILFIIDGAKGLSKGIKSVFGKKAVIQRCQWHKRENVMSYLPKIHKSRMRKKLQRAYELPTYKEAKAALVVIGKELKLMNESAARSLEEGLEETLTLHKLDMFDELGRSFKTTNCIESFNRQLEIYTGRVSYWKNSNQRQRWLATAVLEIEPRLNKVQGHRHLAQLREVMKVKSIEIKMKKAA